MLILLKSNSVKFTSNIGNGIVRIKVLMTQATSRLPSLLAQVICSLPLTLTFPICPRARCIFAPDHDLCYVVP